jgi:hypothetical protein
LKAKILFFAGIIFVSLHSFAQNGSKILLNKTYEAKVIEDYNTPDSNIWKDKIIFKNNKLYFKTFSKNWGFPYDTCTFSIDSNSTIINFIGAQVEDDEDDIRWLKGTINGEFIEGTVQIFRNDGVLRPYSFSGKIK